MKKVTKAERIAFALFLLVLVCWTGIAFPHARHFSPLNPWLRVAIWIGAIWAICLLVRSRRR
jgi:hypothetical protein